MENDNRGIDDDGDGDGKNDDDDGDDNDDNDDDDDDDDNYDDDHVAKQSCYFSCIDHMCPPQPFSTHHILWVDDIFYAKSNYEQLMIM